MRTLRVLAILTKRQMTDDGPLLIGAFAGAMVFLLVLGLLAFIYPQGLLLHVVAILLVLPFLLGMGFFTLGSVQVRGDEHRGIPPMLSVLCVTSSQVILARIIAGTTFVIVIAGGLDLAITGAVISGFVQWPESLVPGGFIDLFAAHLLMGAGCYLLGLSVGQCHAVLGRLLGLLVFVPLLVSLIVSKGLGQSLAIVLVPLLGALLACQLIHKRRSHFSCMSIGFVVLTLVLIPLFWLRHAQQLLMSPVVFRDAGRTTISSYDLLDPLGERDPNSAGFTVRASVCSGILRMWSGDVHFLQPAGAIIDVIEHHGAKKYGYPIYRHYFGSYPGFCYDKRRKLFVHNAGQGTLYAGLEGIARAPVKSIGRFLSPVACWADQRNLIIFDLQSRCFYAIHADLQDIRSGPSITEPAFQPVNVISPRLRSEACSVRGYHGGFHEGILRTDYSGEFYVPVVEESGDISVLDVNSLTLRRGAGCLPRPYTIFGRGSSRPRDLYDYEMKPIFVHPKGAYAGLLVASLSRRDAVATLAVFDREGRPLEPAHSAHFPMWAPVTYMIESLHPPVLTLASFFTAYNFEAGATHRALFLMPNSFVALQRDRETSFLFQFLAAVLFLLPALLVSGFLSWRVVRDARVMGVSRRARRLWWLGTLAFGLPAYITYRLTRPRIALALCRDCGRGRRVDMDACHHCGSGWDVPVLEPPAWRVTSP